MSQAKLRTLLGAIRNCRLCDASLPLGPRPVVRASHSARILVAGQAPGTRVHASGIPFDDPSGYRLRDWMGVEKETFYDEKQIAIVPMGFCYPGSAERGDLPPRPECAKTWHPELLPLLDSVELVLVIGAHAHRYHLGKDRKKSLTETVKHWRNYLPRYVPLPHPSPRNNVWIKRNPWFAMEVLPVLQQRVGAILETRVNG